MQLLPLQLSKDAGFYLLSMLELGEAPVQRFRYLHFLGPFSCSGLGVDALKI